MKITTLVLALIFCQAQAWAEVKFKKDLMDYKVEIGERFVVDLKELVDDAEGALVWSASKELPRWLKLDSEVEMMFGVPSVKDVGTTQFMIAVRDGDSGAVAQMKIEVVRPKPEHITFKKSIFKERLLSGASNAFPLNEMVEGVEEGETVHWSLSGDAPKWVRLEDGNLIAEPGPKVKGRFTFTIFGHQGEIGASAQMVLEVAKEFVNQAPVWVSKLVNLGPLCAGHYVTTDLNQFVSDPEGDALTFTMITDTLPEAKITKAGELVIRSELTTWSNIYRVDVVANDGNLDSVASFHFQIQACDK